MKKQQRVLVVGESSHLHTGYAVMTRNLVRGLIASGEFEAVGEMGVYGTWDAGTYAPPWPYFPVPPRPDDEQDRKEYERGGPYAEFGAARFEQACLEFAPDCCVAFSDTWMCSFLAESVYRPFYRFVYQPTVDGDPQQPEWLDLYRRADRLLAYTEYGKSVIEGETAGRLHVPHVAPPGVDLEVFSPPPGGDRMEHRRKLGIEQDVVIIGMVARNMVRKLYPDLFEAFALYLREVAPEELKNRTYLYIHTGWPDLGWDLPRLIKETGIGHRLLVTYLCKRCGVVFPSFWQDALAVCKRCRHPSARLSDNQQGAVPPHLLADIYKLFDCYTQLSVCEGIGIPQMEAAACGVPAFAVDYSGMASVLDALYPSPAQREKFAVPVERFYRDVHTHRRFALPDIRGLAERWASFLRLPPSARSSLSRQARRVAEQKFSWGQFVEKWTRAIKEEGDNHPLPWSHPERKIPPSVPSLPDNASNEEFVRWGALHVAGRPDLLDSYHFSRVLHDLNWQRTLTDGAMSYHDLGMGMAGYRPNFTEYTREHAMRTFARLRQDFERHEQARARRFCR